MVRSLDVLKKMEVLNRMPFEKKSFIFEKLAEIAEVRKLTKQEQLQYDRSLKAYRDTVNIFDTAMSKGRAEGRVEGRAEGFVEGLAQGRAETRAETLLATARKMKSMGLADDVIAQATGLAEDDIKKL